MWLMIVTLEGARRHFTLPIPLVILWPILLPAMLLAALVALVRAPRLAWPFVRFGGSCVFHLSGMEARVRNRDGEGVRVRFI
jgi:hypothetical protein